MSYEDEKEEMLQTIEGAANYLRGMSLDMRIPSDTRQACVSKADELDAFVEQRLEEQHVGVGDLDVSEGGETD